MTPAACLSSLFTAAAAAAAAAAAGVCVCVCVVLVYSEYKCTMSNLYVFMLFVALPQQHHI